MVLIILTVLSRLSIVIMIDLRIMRISSILSEPSVTSLVLIGSPPWMLMRRSWT